MSDMTGVCTELTALWPALAAALARDTANPDTPGAHTWAAATVVNADVLAAMILLGRDIPAITRTACESLGERWQQRDLQTCLRQLPRLAGRMHDLGLTVTSKRLEDTTRGWLRITKRALGLRKPDIPIGYPCPWAAEHPENHGDAVMLVCGGDEGFLRPRPGGTTVEWVASAQIYCPAHACGATWSPPQWPLLGRMLAVSATISA